MAKQKIKIPIYTPTPPPSHTHRTTLLVLHHGVANVRLLLPAMFAGFCLHPVTLHFDVHFSLSTFCLCYATRLIFF